MLKTEQIQGKMLTRKKDETPTKIKQLGNHLLSLYKSPPLSLSSSKHLLNGISSVPKAA
jgi:hypothetical protein